MATNTTNFNLIKPSLTDAADITAFNANWDTIDATLKKLDESGGAPIVVAESSDGVAYTTTVNSISELTNGYMLTIIPSMTSTSKNATLNVNGLGAKRIYLPMSFNTSAMSAPRDDTFLGANRPITLQYDAKYLTGAWKMLGKQKTAAQDLYGAVPIENGGTKATTADEARTNLNAQKQVKFSMTDLTAGVSALADGEVYLVYE